MSWRIGDAISKRVESAAEIWADPEGDHVLFQFLTKPDAGIKSISNDVTKLIVDQNLNRRFRMRPEESWQSGATVSNGAAPLFCQRLGKARDGRLDCVVGKGGVAQHQSLLAGTADPVVR